MDLKDATLMFPAELAAHRAVAGIAQAAYNRLVHISAAGQPSKTMATISTALMTHPQTAPMASGWQRALPRLRAWDRRDRHRHARPCAAPLLRRQEVSAWTGEAEDPVLRHTRGPRCLLDDGRGPGAVV
jgi:hypothetical protein